MIKLDDYTYNLPETAIAIHPPKIRGNSKLLVLQKKDGKIQDSLYKNLDSYVRPGDVLVMNNTKVIPARLIVKNEVGTDRELLLLEKHGKEKDHHSSLVMYRRKIRAGQMLYTDTHTIVVDEVFPNGTARIHCSVDLWDIAEAEGTVPLPPYMHREEEPEDRERYQTVFAKEKGSVAAPTASLNMTPRLLQTLKDKGIILCELTLHVGLGTFMPIRVDDLTEHTMHQEYFEIPLKTAETIRKAKQEGRRVIAVGTTVTRTLEYAAEQIINSKNEISGEADIFIYPGYSFKIIDGLLTNFHAPESTVLMMAAAFAGWNHLRRAYEHALLHEYAFLSYGDSMLIV